MINRAGSQPIARARRMCIDLSFDPKSIYYCGPVCIGILLGQTADAPIFI